MKSAIPSGSKQQLAVILLLLFSIPSGVAQRGAPHARLSLISDRTALAPGTSTWVGLRFELDPGWHIYWTNPGDSGEPPKVRWHLPEGIEAGDLQFPAPQRIKDHSLTDYGYRNQVILLSKLTIPNVGDTPGNEDIGADVRYLVCREVCVPGTEHLSLKIPFVSLATQAKNDIKSSASAEAIRNATVHLPKPLPTGVEITASSKGDEFLVTITSKARHFGLVTDFIPADPQVIENSKQPGIETGKDEQVITLKKSDQLDHPVQELRGLLITNGQAYSTTIPVVNPSKATSQKTNSQKDHVSKKS